MFHEKYLFILSLMPVTLFNKRLAQAKQKTEKVVNCSKKHIRFIGNKSVTWLDINDPPRRGSKEGEVHHSFETLENNFHNVKLQRTWGFSSFTEQNIIKKI